MIRHNHIIDNGNLRILFRYFLYPFRSNPARLFRDGKPVPYDQCFEIVPVGEHFMFPKKTHKFRGQIISAPTSPVSINCVGTGVLDRPLIQRNLRTVREAGPYAHRNRLCEIKELHKPEFTQQNLQKKIAEKICNH